MVDTKSKSFTSDSKQSPVQISPPVITLKDSDGEILTVKLCSKISFTGVLEIWCGNEHLWNIAPLRDAVHCYTVCPEGKSFPNRDAVHPLLSVKGAGAICRGEEL